MKVLLGWFFHLDEVFLVISIFFSVLNRLMDLIKPKRKTFKALNNKLINIDNY